MLARPQHVNASSALNYHKEAKDNYYQNEGDLGSWQGKLAEGLGLTGAVTAEDLEHMLWGRDPKSGEQLVNDVRTNSNGDRIRSALDLTFTAPKSVSIAMEAAIATGREDIASMLINAHHQAVEKTLNLVEERYAQARETHKGETRFVQTSNLAIGKFTHTTARGVEDSDGNGFIAPNLHTHAVVMNMTKTDKGFKSLSSEKIFDNFMASGMQYRAELASVLKELGIAMRSTDASKGFFELDNVSDELIKEMSPRAAQIAEEVTKLKEQFPNASMGELKQMAAHKTRSWKGKMDRDEVRADNIRRIEKLGYSKEEILAFKTFDRTTGQENDKELADKYIKNAIQATTDQKAVFARENIVSAAQKFALKDALSPELLERAFDENMQQNKEKTQMFALSNDKYTTKEFMQAERYLLDYTRKNKDTFENQFTPDEALLYINKFSNLQEHPLKSGQIDAGVHILSSKGQIIGIQGDAGTGKTTLLKSVNAIAEPDSLIGLSYTGKAAVEIENATGLENRVKESAEMFENAGIPSKTLSKFLGEASKMSKEKKAQFAGKKLIVDEASMLGTRDAQKLVNFTRESGAQLILMGDTKQFDAISAGSPFKLLQNNGMDTIHMDQVVRQKDSTLIETVTSLNSKRKDRAENALNILDKAGKVHEMGTYIDENGEKAVDNELFLQESVEKIVDEYFKHPTETDIVISQKQLFDQMVLSNTNATKTVLNDALRSKAKELGFVSVEDEKINVKESTRLNPTDKYFAENYAVGQYVTVNSPIKEHLNEKNTNGYLILSVNADNNTITVDTNSQNEDIPKSIVVDLTEHGGKLQAYKEQEKDFAVGDKIVFEKNENKKYNVKNGEIAKIVSIDGDNMTVDKDGKELMLDTKEYNYFSHGYATSLHKSQGGTGERVWAVMPSSIQDFSSFYVAATRAVNDFNVITDNKELLAYKINHENSKENVMDFLNVDKIKELLDENKIDNALKFLNENKEAFAEEDLEKIEKIFDDFQHDENWKTLQEKLQDDSELIYEQKKYEHDSFLEKMEEPEQETKIDEATIDRMIKEASIELQKTRKSENSY
ncbi:MAG: conjugative relaxase [Erysipelotrichia bacterium]|nr:conjugative relaxase [Erysipelotrichia bacterium]